MPRLSIVIGVLLALTAAGCTTAPPTPPTPSSPILEAIVAPSGGFSLLPMLGGWVVDANAAEDFPDAEIVLSHAEVGVTALVFLHPGATDSLDAVVLGRRELVDSHWEIISLQERRRFQAPERMVPVSISEYRIAEPGGGWSPVTSGVVRGEASSVEILAIGGRYPESLQLLEDLVAGVRIVDDAGAAH